jgi:RNA polymerase sigma-70 factor (ECF subfamily)
MRDDHELITAIAAGSEAAMNEFFQRHHKMVYAFALRRLTDGADAADVLNDVMLQVWRGASRYAGDAKVTTWLLGIANHKIMDIFRQRARHDHDELDESYEGQSTGDATSAIAASQDAELIKRCMDKLSGAHREVVHLAFFEDMAYPDIAEALQIPAGTVKTRMMHAKQNIKRCLGALAAM